jgi:hypothetical protein
MVSHDDIIDFLRHHRCELMVLYEMMDEDEEGQLDRVEISRRIACIDALLSRQDVDAAHTTH